MNGWKASRPWDNSLPFQPPPVPHSSTHTHTKLLPEYMLPPNTLSIFILPHWNPFFPFLVHRYSTHPYQPLKSWTNAFSLMKFLLAPHLPLALAESVALTVLCLYLHFSKTSGLQFTVCVICSCHKITSYWGTGIPYSIDGSQSPAVIACSKE